MNLLSILLILLAMLILYFGIHLVINRGKIKLNYLIIIVLYSFAVGIPVAYFNTFPEKMNLVFYILYYAVFLLPNFGYYIYNCIKGRQPWWPFLLLSTGIVLILFSPALKHPEKHFIIFAGLAFVTGFFIHLFRYPHLNPMWLEDAAKKAAAGVDKNCRYSSKPVVLPIPSRSTSFTSIKGLHLYFKKKAVIVKISKEFHERLGKPNMEKYAEALVKRIKDKVKGGSSNN